MRIDRGKETRGKRQRRGIEARGRNYCRVETESRDRVREREER
jgi:hypothetical protein